MVHLWIHSFPPFVSMPYSSPVDSGTSSSASVTARATPHHDSVCHYPAIRAVSLEHSDSHRLWCSWPDSPGRAVSPHPARQQLSQPNPCVQHTGERDSDLQRVSPQRLSPLKSDVGAPSSENPGGMLYVQVSVLTRVRNPTDSSRRSEALPDSWQPSCPTRAQACGSVASDPGLSSLEHHVCPPPGSGVWLSQGLCPGCQQGVSCD